MNISDIKWWHRIKLPEGITPGICDHSGGDPDYITNRFGMPEDLTGKSVLDIGCWDGLFSFEAEKRGAAMVLATDIYQAEWTNNEGFQYAKAALKSKVEFLPIPVDLIDQIHTYVRYFDVVLFYGVLYHLKDPHMALKKIATVTREMLLLETAVMEMTSPTPTWTRVSGNGGDPTNEWYPNLAALEEELLILGFNKVSVVHNMGNSRITIKAEK